MPVLCTFISVIIRRDSIDKYFQGGWQRFVLELPNYSMCTDGELVNVGFMNPNAVLSYIEFLKSEGLQYEQSSNDQSKTRSIDDVDVVDRFDSDSDKRDWIEFGDKTFNDQKSFCCWLKGTTKKTLAIPNSYNKGEVVYNIPPHISPDKFAERFSFLRTENDLDIYLDSKYKGEYYLPQGMDIEDYYAQSNEKRKQRQLKVLAQKLDKQAEKEEKKRMADEEVSWEERVKKNKKKRQAEHIVRANKAVIEAEKKRQAEQKKIEKKIEEKFNAKVSEILIKCKVYSKKPTDILEALIGNALTTRKDKDVELAGKFFSDNFCDEFVLDEDEMMTYQNVNEVIDLMLTQWNDYIEEDEMEITDERKFSIFKEMLTSVDEHFLIMAKQTGKYVISSGWHPMGGFSSSFRVFHNLQELYESYKQVGTILFRYDKHPSLNYSEKELRDFFDKHYLNSK